MFLILHSKIQLKVLILASKYCMSNKWDNKKINVEAENQAFDLRKLYF